MNPFKLQTTIFITLVMLVFCSSNVSGCPIPPPPGVPLPEGFEALRIESPELWELPEGAVERLQKIIENRELLEKGLITPQEAENRGGIKYKGVWKVPVILGLFSNSPQQPPFQMSELQRELTPVRGSPPWPTGTLKEFYTENSYGNFTFQSTVVHDWVRVSQEDTFYEGGCTGFTPSFQCGSPCNPGQCACNGICASRKTEVFVKDILDMVDPSVDFSQYDNDGNDGLVEVVVVIHPEVDGSCGSGNTNIWAHMKSNFQYVTNDMKAGKNVRIESYIIAGLDCNGNITKIGVIAHELGHVLGLPDLYDTDYSSNGLGEWELMAAGAGHGGGARPSHLCSWSKNLLGWLIPREVRSPESDMSIGPLASEGPRPLKLSDPTAPLEYFLLENRQKIGFDDGLPGSGLLIYHVDDSAGSGNRVNVSERCIGSGGISCVAGTGHYRIALEQADAKCHLECRDNRGEDGDPFPGSTNNTTFDENSTPNSSPYSGAKTCVAVRNIRVSGQDIIVDVDACLGPPQAKSIPDRPTSGDNVVIQVSGTWPDSCIPSDPQLSVQGNLIIITTSHDCSGGCQDALTDFDFAVPVGQLPSGIYQVLVTYNCLGDVPRDIVSDFFRVTSGEIPSLTHLGIIVMALFMLLFGIKGLRRIQR